MDGLVECLTNKFGDKQQIISMKQTLNAEEFDSDAVEQDVFKNDIKQSNISQFLENNKEKYEAIQDYIYNIKCLFCFYCMNIFMCLCNGCI